MNVYWEKVRIVSYHFLFAMYKYHSMCRSKLINIITIWKIFDDDLNSYHTYSCCLRATDEVKRH